MGEGGWLSNMSNNLSVVYFGKVVIILQVNGLTLTYVLG